MKSSYKRLGDYIEPCGEKNSSNLEFELRGISNQKFFQKAKANTIGVDLSKYRIVRTGQFAFNRATTRNGDKISIALSQEPDCIVSPSYRIFRSKDENILNSEYLMMWFRRPEFDRYARYKSHGSAHEFFDYDEMCDVELPIPSIEKQRAIVKEYNTVVNRIKLNEQLNQKLEETAQALYKHWFVDFEFPNENGQPYKSSGGEMVYNEELNLEVPEKWKVNDLKSFQLDVSDGNYSGKYPKSSEFKKEGIPFIRGTDFDGYFINPSSFRYITPQKHSELKKGHTKQGDILITTRGAYIGNYAFIPEKFIGVNINSQLVRLNGDKSYPQFFLGLKFSSREFRVMLEGAITGSAQPQLSVTNLMGMRLLKPMSQIICLFCSKYDSIHKMYLLKYEETISLIKSKDILLSNMSKTKFVNN